MSDEDVKENDWIYVGEKKIPAYVIRVASPQHVYAGYFQNGLKAIKDEFILTDNGWEFKYSGPSGSYLTDRLEAIVKQGPDNET